MRIARFVVALLIVKLWQERLGPWFNRQRSIVCRFHPSCSQYTIEAVLGYGVFRGLQMGYQRIRRCTPENTASCIDFP